MKNQVEQKINSIRSNWYVWIFPIIALVFCGYLYINYRNQSGPTIKILFDDASSIQAEKTRVRYRGVTIGVVKKISLSEDSKEAIAYIALTREAEGFAVEGTKFWIVSPKVNFQGVSGLETLFEGTYIAAHPGKENGEEKTEFKGQLTSDSNESVENTTSYFLETANAESVSTGDSITFRGIPVGIVSKVTLSKTAQLAVVQINIQNRYTKLIRTNTAFWRKVGIQANLGLFNSEIKMNSLDSILHGGVEFFTPDAAGEIAKSQSRFTLYTTAPKDYQKWNPKLDL